MKYKIGIFGVIALACSYIAFADTSVTGITQSVEDQGLLINSATEKTTPVDADMVGLMDSAASNVLKKLSWANLKTQLKSQLGFREVLTDNRTYYVRSDGSDSNDGLTNTSGGAFLTIQNAINVAAALDSSIYNVTIKIGNSGQTFTENLIAKTMVGAGSITIEGYDATPSNTIITITPSTGVNLFSLANIPTFYTLKNVKLTSTNSSDSKAVLVQQGSVTVTNIEIGTGFSTVLLRASINGLLSVSGGLTLSGGAQYAFDSTNGYLNMSGTITFSGTPAYSVATAQATRGGVIATSATMSGAATGKRYSITGGGIIETYGGGANYFPGNSAGTGGTTTGGGFYS